MRDNTATYDEGYDAQAAWLEVGGKTIDEAISALVNRRSSVDCTDPYNRGAEQATEDYILELTPKGERCAFINWGTRCILPRHDGDDHVQPSADQLRPRLRGGLMAVTITDEQYAAVERFVTVCQDTMFLVQVGGALTCTEADAFADLFRAFVGGDLADEFLALHAESDTEEGDAHQHLRRVP